MNELVNTKQLNTLWQKVQSDLSFGVKILGNYANQTDIIRVWTRLGETVFIIIANSSKRFDVEINTVEIQSFTGSGGYKLAIMQNSAQATPTLDISAWCLNTNFVEKPILDEQNEEFFGFINDYLSSIAEPIFIKAMFEKNYYNANQYEWVRPELYK